MSGMDEHLDLELSAYLDEALLPEERAPVEAHLRACRLCGGRLAELRATARLIGALPSPRPTRSLVPRLERGWSWLRPLRSLSAVSSGAFLFLFLAAAVLESGSGLGGGGRGSLLGPLPQSQPAGAPALETAATPAPTDVAFSTLPPPADQGAARGAATPESEGAKGDAVGLDARRPSLGSPSLWLALAVGSGALALALHRRLRAVRA